GVDQLDTSAASRAVQETTASCAGAATHSASVAVAGNKIAVSADTCRVSDAIAAAAAAPLGTTFEDTSSQVSFTGTWAGWSDAGNSGGSAKYTNQTGASVALGFTGTFVQVVFVKQPNAGIATVTIDGGVVDQLDMYAASRAFQQTKTYTVAAGNHSVSVAVSGNKNAASADTYLIFDAFVAAAAAPLGTTFEDTSSQVSFTATWSGWSDAGNSGGSAKYTNQTSATVALRFT